MSGYTHSPKKLQKLEASQRKLARVLVVRENPKRPSYQWYGQNPFQAESNQLGYGKNRRYWAIRMVSSYGRYVKPMERRQRLNGTRSTMKIWTIRVGLRYSPSSCESTEVPRWVALL
jgi:hypothetical protein